MIVGLTDKIQLLVIRWSIKFQLSIQQVASGWYWSQVISVSKSMSQNTRLSQGLYNSVSSGWSSITSTSFIFSKLELVYIISFELLRPPNSQFFFTFQVEIKYTELLEGSGASTHFCSSLQLVTGGAFWWW